MINLGGKNPVPRSLIIDKNTATDKALDKIIESEQYDNIDFYLYDLLNSIQAGNSDIDLIDLRARISAEIEKEKYKSSFDEKYSNSPIPPISKLRYVLYILENDPQFISYADFIYDVPETYEGF